MRNLAVVLGAFLALFFPGFTGCASARVMHPSANRAAVPSLDVQSGCRDVSQMQIKNKLNFDRCIAEEKTARTELEKTWRTFPRDMQQQCMHLVTPPALPSYVTLQECLGMARDAQKLARKDQSSSPEARVAPTR